MPNRYIRESAIESEGVNALSWQGEVFYRRLLNRVDDFGRFTANLALLRASIFPLQLDKVREVDISRLLLECEQAGLLFRYAADSKVTLIINRWEQGRAKESKYPPPPADLCERMQTYVYTRKQKLSDAPDSDSDTDSNSDADKSLADLIYEAYPRKQGKQDALKAIAKVLQLPAGKTLLERTKAYAIATASWPVDERQFIPHPATWFNRGSYDDDPATWTRSKPAHAAPVQQSMRMLNC